jgi:uncharacterized protein YdhG (YjbR/CyaY superfamily)
MDKKSPTTIDEYIAGYPANVQEILQKVRATVRQALPDAQEAIKYGMPTYVQNGNVLSFGAYKKHIGVYPTPGGTEKFQQEIAPYKAAKSTVQFPLDQPIPYPLLSQLAKFRLKEHSEYAAARAKKK